MKIGSIEVAERFQTDLDNVLAAATVALGADRGSRPAQLSHNVERLADRFDRNSQELLEPPARRARPARANRPAT